jgi:hypothetical protein
LFPSLVSVGALCLQVIGQVPGRGDVVKFAYRPERVAVGTVYHYLKSNADGSHPLHVALYVAGPDRLESLKYQEERKTAWLVIANLDWSIFSANHLQTWQLSPDGRRKAVAELTFRNADSSAKLSSPVVKLSARKNVIWHSLWDIQVEADGFTRSTPTF